MVIQRTVIQKMGKQIISPILLALGLMSSSVWAQNAAAVIAEAARTMGVEGLDSITYYGAGTSFALGQTGSHRRHLGQLGSRTSGPFDG